MQNGQVSRSAVAAAAVGHIPGGGTRGTMNDSVRAIAPLGAAVATAADAKASAPAARDVIAVRRLAKTYGGTVDGVDALRDIDFTVAEGEFMSIVGPSGCGKST